ncbi:hypothetical protein FHS41_002888 [Streptomyces violarus]|uniref:Uncharacterized protein n=1 Tax=Streptomyces violarus TaxID=67380 RepID=A0A7W5F1D9_9ACTN|nr:hypothetical protein [Streptomyces violarus]
MSTSYTATYRRTDVGRSGGGKVSYAPFLTHQGVETTMEETGVIRPRG